MQAAVGMTSSGRQRKVVRLALITIGSVVAIAAAALVVFALIFDQYSVPSESMAPTVNSGDRVVVRQGATPDHGDVVIYNNANRPDSAPLLKRVVAIGPDRIDFIDGEIALNGQILDEPYLAEAGVTFELSAGAIPGCVTSSPTFCVLPEGTVFVLGDNRRESTDSRRIGPVNTDDIRGVMVWQW